MICLQFFIPSRKGPAAAPGEGDVAGTGAVREGDAGELGSGTIIQPKRGSPGLDISVDIQSKTPSKSCDPGGPLRTRKPPKVQSNSKSD